MYPILNLASILLGFFALIIPIRHIKKTEKSNSGTLFAHAIVSMFSCAASFCLQLFAISQKVSVADWSALTDTVNIIAFVALLLLSGAIFLNILALVSYRRKPPKTPKQ